MLNPIAFPNRTRTTVLTLLLIALAFGRSANATEVEKAKVNHLVIVTAQVDSVYKLDRSRQTTINLAGTTPIRDWTMRAQGLSGRAIMTVNTDLQLIAITSLRFQLPVRNLKGDAQVMDNSAYASLKADSYPMIVFELTNAVIEQARNSQSRIQALGKLTVAGVTKVVTLNMSANVLANGSIAFSGSQPLKMSDYNVERPSLFFGTIKAADAMSLSYSLLFIQ